MTCDFHLDQAHLLAAIGVEPVASTSRTEIKPIEITDPRHLEVWGPGVVKICFEAADLDKANFGLSIKLE